MAQQIEIAANAIIDNNLASETVEPTTEAQTLSLTQEELDALQDAYHDAAEEAAVAVGYTEGRLQDLADITDRNVDELTQQYINENPHLFNPDEILATSSPVSPDSQLDPTSDIDMEDNSNTGSDMDISSHESLLPLILLIFHQGLSKKYITKWNKFITTPIILDRKGGIESNTLKTLRFVSTSVVLVSLLSTILLLNPLLLDCINWNYLLISITNIIEYITNNFHSTYNYLKGLYDIFNFTDNTSKIVSPETKLINSEVADNDEPKEIVDITNNSTPFYKTKTFIICSTLLLSSCLIYLYCNNLLPFFQDNNIYETQSIEHLLDHISQQNLQYNKLRVEYLALLDEKNGMMDCASKHDEFLRSIQSLRDSIHLGLQNVETVEVRLGSVIDNFSH
jgi:hypothetical protein